MDTAAQIPWYEKLSEFKMPWEMQCSKQMAIEGLNLRVHSGQMLAVIGSSGVQFHLSAAGRRLLKHKVYFSINTIT